MRPPTTRHATWPPWRQWEFCRPTCSSLLILTAACSVTANDEACGVASVAAFGMLSFYMQFLAVLHHGLPCDRQRRGMQCDLQGGGQDVVYLRAAPAGLGRGPRCDRRHRSMRRDFHDGGLNAVDLRAVPAYPHHGLPCDRQRRGMRRGLGGGFRDAVGLHAVPCCSSPRPAV